MRYLIFSASLSIFSLSWFALGVQAQALPAPDAGEVVLRPVVITPDLVAAQHAYQLAQLRWQQYRFVELPRQRKLLDNQLRLGESEIRVLKRRLRDYRPFLQVGRYSPVRTAAEYDQLALQFAEQQLELLSSERTNLMRYSRQHGQLYQLEVLRTAARVREAMASGEIRPAK
jgi:hypothetical protein